MDAINTEEATAAPLPLNDEQLDGLTREIALRLLTTLRPPKSQGGKSATNGGPDDLRLAAISLHDGLAVLTSRIHAIDLAAESNPDSYGAFEILTRDLLTSVNEVQQCADKISELTRRN